MSTMPAGGPQAEVSAVLPFFPRSGAGSAIAAEAAGDIAARSFAAMAARAEAGDAAAFGVLALLATDAAAAVSHFAQLAGAGGAGHDLYEIARSLDEAGSGDDALIVLAVLAGLEDGQAGMLGLAVLAVRRDRMDVAADLVAACLEAEERHPRACSLAGIIELGRGDRQAAQAYLATASRIARRRPEFRAEMQIAQRALLLMHLA